MIKYYEGTVFNVETDAIVNTVNCTGFMGAGIALEFKLRYPDMFIEYEEKCLSKKMVTGKVDYYRNNDGILIVNFPTKWNFKYPSKMIWIEQGLKNFVDTYKQYQFSSIAFPKLGTSNGGLMWEDVKNLMEKYLAPLNIDVYICLDEKKEAEGVEKIMLDHFNSMSIEQLSDSIKLNHKQKENILKNMPYERFWQILNTEAVGMKTYSILFNYFYKSALDDQIQPIQISILDL